MSQRIKAVLLGALALLASSALWLPTAEGAVSLVARYLGLSDGTVLAITTVADGQALVRSGTTVTGSSVQPVDADLTTIAGLSPSAGQGLGWDGGWAAVYTPQNTGRRIGFMVPSSGSTPSTTGHAVTYTAVGTTASIVNVDSEPGQQLVATANDIGYTPSAFTSFTVPTAGAVVMEQSWQSQQTLTNYAFLRWGWTAATIAAVTETATTPARICVVVQPDGDVFLETVDGAARTATQVSGLTWATGTTYQTLLAVSSAGATVRIRAAGGSTVYSATSAATLPAAGTQMTGQLFLDRSTGNTGAQWTGLQMWRARAAL